MDWVDITLKFSSELLVLGLTLLVVVLNVFFFGLGHGKMYADNSHAAQFLSQHYTLNPKLYAKETSISMVVVRQNDFIAQAQADDAFLGSNSVVSDPNDLTSDAIANDGAFIKLNPDSISSLIAKQIKIYQTQAGDTVSSVAAANGISKNTLQWANNLTSDTLKPGWQLIILPTNGILHKATNNDTLPDIAKKYSVDINSIISYNGLENAEDIDPDQLIIVPGGVMPEPPKPKPVPTPKPKPGSGKVNPGATTQPKDYDEGSGHIFPWGYCTYYVATRTTVPWGGNAKNWLSNAKAFGAVVNKEPAKGTILVTNESRRYGHVAYVESVDEKGFTISEMNYEQFGKVDTRWIPNGSSIIKGFIHP